MSSIREDLMELMRKEDYVPLPSEEISKQLKLSHDKAKKLERIIKEMLRDGSIAKVKGNAYCLPYSADLISGTLQFLKNGCAILEPENRQDATAHIRYFVRAENTSTAMHGDYVLCRVMSGTGRFDNEAEIRRHFREHGKEEINVRVIRILKRGNATIVGTLQKSKYHFYIVPDNPRIIQDILVPDPKKTKTRPMPTVNDKVAVRLIEWKQRHLNPQGEIVRVFGRMLDPQVEYQSILYKFNLDPDFSRPVIGEVEQISQKVTDEQRNGRLDIRHVFTITIDPDDAKDFDDALSIENLPNGNTRIGVHIADVSAYVTANGELDKEARKRGNSTYLVGTVIPMLPHALSNGICSLVEREDRLTKSVFFTFDKNHRIINRELANTVINSSKRLTYQQAYAFLRTDNLEEIKKMPLPAAHETGYTGKALNKLSSKELGKLQSTIRTFWFYAERMRRERMKGGSLDLDMPEVKIHVDEKGYPSRIERVQHDESHQLIEEFMLKANEEVAGRIDRAHMPGIYRVHDDPDPLKLQDLREYLMTMGIKTGDLTHIGEVKKFLSFIDSQPESYIFKVAFLRSLKKACYRASPDGHYGLQKKDYCHFTSPIRRYADLVMHRLFDRLLLKEGADSVRKDKLPPSYRIGQLTEISEHISGTEKNSAEAERESSKIKLLQFFKREAESKQKTVFTALITDLQNHGMFIELTESMAFGFIHVSTIRDDLYVLNQHRTALVGRRHKQQYKLGQEIKVITDHVDLFKREIDFRIAEQPENKSRKR